MISLNTYIQHFIASKAKELITTPALLLNTHFKPDQSKRCYKPMTVVMLKFQLIIDATDKPIPIVMFENISHETIGSRLT